MVISAMIKLVICSFTKNWNLFSIMPPYGITGATPGTSKEKNQIQNHYIYDDGTENQECFTNFTKTNKSSQYLFKLIPEKIHAYATRNVDNIPCFKIRHNFFKKSFFPSTIIEWNNLDLTLWNSKNFCCFQKYYPEIITLSPSHVFNCDNHNDIRLITQLRVCLSHLREHKFKHNFQDCLNPICSCGLDIESTSYFLLHFPAFNDETIHPPEHFE